MEDPAASASGQSARKEGGRPKRSRKASLKRTATPKEKKPKNVRWPVGSNYTVQQGEDMLFVMSNVVSEDEDTLWQTESEKRKAAKDGIQASQTKKKPKRQFKMPGEKDMAGSVRPGCRPGFGQNLPEEVLIKIFQMVVVQDGAVPFLCRMSQVCHLWNIAASSPLLWRKATLGHCWIAPGKDQTPETKKMVMDTVNWLAHNRFSQLRDFSLCHWTKNVSSTLEAVSQSCPHLASIKLSYCSGLNASAFLSLGQHSRSLHSIDLQYSEFQVEGFRGYLEEFGSQIKQILFTHGVKYHRLLKAISIGYCPDLELLEVNTKLDSKNCELAVCIQALQRACPKLKTFRMLNVRPSMRSSGDTPVGFPLLEELCIATTSNSYMTDKDLMAVLFGSTKLRVLDIRGCSRITADGLAELPCPELECLFWGQYFNTDVVSSFPKTGLPMVTEKWGHTLQQLDIANHLFAEEDLELAVSFLAPVAEAGKLHSLNLSGTRITPTALRSVIGPQTALGYLNVSSCRYLPRGVKKIYRSQEEIRQLLDQLE